MPKSRFHGLIKDYDGGTLMEVINNQSFVDLLECIVYYGFTHYLIFEME